jgi:hypothetical protein
MTNQTQVDMPFRIKFLCGFLPVQLSRLALLKLGYRGFEVRPEGRCPAMFFGAALPFRKVAEVKNVET